VAVRNQNHERGDKPFKIRLEHRKRNILKPEEEERGKKITLENNPPLRGDTGRRLLARKTGRGTQPRIRESST